jgi:predicted transcriptional regulator
MTKTLTHIVKRVSAWPEKSREAFSKDMLARVDALEELRAKIAVGMRSIEKGRVVKIDKASFIKALRKRHARAKKK